MSNVDIQPLVDVLVIHFCPGPLQCSAGLQNGIVLP
jgi:hypothetical protein